MNGDAHKPGPDVASARNIAARWREEIATALMFLTRVPVGAHASGDPAVLTRAVRWFPLVGAGVGGALAATLAFLAGWLPASVAVVGTLGVAVLLTGAFHEDGLADVADSAGAFDVDAKLAIMRDSRVGTYGALALVLSQLAKYALLLALLDATGLATVALAFVTAHVLARVGSVQLMASVPYARPEAANRVVAAGVGVPLLMQTLAVAAVLLLTACATLATSPGIAAATLLAAPALAAAVAALAGRRARRVFGGITGDVLGAINQLVEIAVMLLFVALFVDTGGA